MAAPDVLFPADDQFAPLTNAVESLSAALARLQGAAMLNRSAGHVFLRDLQDEEWDRVRLPVQQLVRALRATPLDAEATKHAVQRVVANALGELQDHEEVRRRLIAWTLEAYLDQR